MKKKEKRNPIFFILEKFRRNPGEVIQCGDAGVKGAGLGSPTFSHSHGCGGGVEKRKDKAWVFCKTSPGDLACSWVRTPILAEKCETALSSILIVRINTLHNAKLVPPANLQADDTA